MALANLTPARLRELFRYEIGQFVQLARTSQRIKVGDVAGCIRNDGYVHICIDGRRYLAHRLAFYYMTGRWPKEQVDHIDGVRSNNRWDNLREATQSQNNQNIRKAPRHNFSCGLLGATQDKRDGRWMSQIEHDGKHQYLGMFATAEEAHAAYIDAKRRLHQFGTL